MKTINRDNLTQEILGALARAFTHKETEKMPMNPPLVQAMLEELKPVIDQLLKERDVELGRVQEEAYIRGKADADFLNNQFNRP